MKMLRGNVLGSNSLVTPSCPSARSETPPKPRAPPKTTSHNSTTTPTYPPHSRLPLRTKMNRTLVILLLTLASLTYTNAFWTRRQKLTTLHDQKAADPPSRTFFHKVLKWFDKKLFSKLPGAKGDKYIQSIALSDAGLPQVNAPAQANEKAAKGTIEAVFQPIENLMQALFVV